MATLNRTLFRVYFPHAGYLARFMTARPNATDREWGEAYAEALKAELSGRVHSGHVETHPRSPYESGGPGVEFDAVSLIVSGTVIATGYAAWRIVAADLHELIQKLRQLGDGRVVVDVFGAEVLAVNSLARPVGVQDVSIRFSAPLRGPDDEEYGSERGFLVGLVVNGVETLVVVSPDGTVLGSTSSDELPGLKDLGL